MLKKDVEVGGRYIAKVANRKTVVRITGTSTRGGWSAVNEATQRQVHIKTAARLTPAAPKAPVARNGNGEPMMTPPQRGLITKLLNEKVVSEDLVTRYHSASLANGVTLAAADMFIKHMINKCPKKSDAQLDMFTITEPVQTRNLMFGHSMNVRALTEDDIKTYDVTMDTDPSQCVAVFASDLGECLAAVVNVTDGHVVWSDTDGEGNEIEQAETFGHALTVVLLSIFPHLS